MTTQRRRPPLVIRAKGPATVDGRMSLTDLIDLCKAFQTAVNRVARVLTGEADSRKKGKKPKEILETCRLDAVALQRGSFEIALDFPNNRLEDMHLGRDAVRHLLQGLQDEQGLCGEILPAGYDVGVLASLRDMGRVFDRGVDSVEIDSWVNGAQRKFAYSPAHRLRIKERIKQPVSNFRTLEGRLVMADFRQEGERCRLHPPIGEPITCQFDESLSEKVHKNLRSHVRISGETFEDSETGRVSRVKIQTLEPVEIGGEAFDSMVGDDFWSEKTLDELATEQDVHPVDDFAIVFGKAADLWEDDEDFDEFLSTSERMVG